MACMIIKSSLYTETNLIVLRYPGWVGVGGRGWKLKSIIPVCCWMSIWSILKVIHRTLEIFTIRQEMRKLCYLEILVVFTACNFSSRGIFGWLAFKNHYCHTTQKNWAYSEQYFIHNPKRLINFDNKWKSCGMSKSVNRAICEKWPKTAQFLSKQFFLYLGNYLSKTFTVFFCYS